MLNGPFRELDIAAQVTGGICPTCTHETMLISLTPEIYRCVS
jgi:hypothetical protein